MVKQVELEHGGVQTNSEFARHTSGHEASADIGSSQSLLGRFFRRDNREADDLGINADRPTEGEVLEALSEPLPTQTTSSKRDLTPLHHLSATEQTDESLESRIQYCLNVSEEYSGQDPRFKALAVRLQELLKEIRTAQSSPSRDEEPQQLRTSVKGYEVEFLRLRGKDLPESLEELQQTVEQFGEVLRSHPWYRHEVGFRELAQWSEQISARLKETDSLTTDLLHEFLSQEQRYLELNAAYLREWSVASTAGKRNSEFRQIPGCEEQAQAALDLYNRASIRESYLPSGVAGPRALIYFDRLDFRTDLKAIEEMKAEMNVLNEQYKIASLEDYRAAVGRKVPRGPLRFPSLYCERHSRYGYTTFAEQLIRGGQTQQGVGRKFHLDEVKEAITLNLQEKEEVIQRFERPWHSDTPNELKGQLESAVAGAKQSYLHECKRFTELLGSIDEPLETAEFRNPKLAAEYAAKAMEMMSIDEGVEWVVDMAVRIQTNRLREPSLREVQGAIFAACRKGLSDKLDVLEQEAQGNPILQQRYEYNCTRLAVMFREGLTFPAGKTNSLIGAKTPLWKIEADDLCNSAWAAYVAKQGLRFDELALSYVEKNSLRPHPVNEAVDSLRDAVREKLKEHGHGSLKSAFPEEWVDLLEKNPPISDIKTLSAQYALLKRLQPLLKIEDDSGLDPASLQEELQELMIKHIQFSRKAFGDYLEGTLAGEPSVEEIEQATGTTLSVNQRENLYVLSRIEGHGYRFSDATGKAAESWIKGGIAIGAGVLVGYLTAGLGTPSAMLIGGGAMTSVSVGMDALDGHSYENGAIRYGGEFLANTLSFGAGRLITAARVAMPLVKSRVIKDTKQLRQFFALTNRAGGAGLLNSFDEAYSLGVRLALLTGDGAIDATAASVLDTALLGVNFTESLQRNIAFLGLPLGVNLAAGINRRIRGIPDEELSELADAMRTITKGRQELVALCKGTDLDAAQLARTIEVEKFNKMIEGWVGEKPLEIRRVWNSMDYSREVLITAFKKPESTIPPTVARPVSIEETSIGELLTKCKQVQETKSTGPATRASLDFIEERLEQYVPVLLAQCENYNLDFDSVLNCRSWEEVDALYLKSNPSHTLDQAELRRSYERMRLYRDNLSRIGENTAVISTDPIDPQRDHFLDTHDILGLDNYVELFRPDQVDGSLRQGEVGNCGPVSCLASLQYSESFEACIRTSLEVNPSGDLHFYFPFGSGRSGHRVTVTESDFSTFANGLEGPKGMKALEIACAKVYGGRGIESLRAEDAIFPLMFHGNLVSEQLHASNAKHIEYLGHTFRERGTLAIVGSGPRVTETFTINNQEFFNGHYYSIVDINPDTRTLYLVDPHNTGELLQVSYRDFQREFDEIQVGFLDLQSLFRTDTPPPVDQVPSL